MGILQNISKTTKIFSQVLGSQFLGSNEPQKPDDTYQPSIMDVYGAPGTQFFAGMIRNEEYVTELKGWDGLKVYDRMRRSDSQVRGTLMALTLPIRQAQWWIEPASESDEDKKIAEIIQENLIEGMQITWDDFLRQALTFYHFGHSLFEICYKEDNGLILIDKLAPRLQKTIWRWFNDSNGNLQIIRQYVQFPDGSFKYIDIPYDKCILFVNDQEGNNYEGISILRSAYKNWYIKNELYTIDALGHDRFSSGIPWMKVPTGFNQNDVNDASTVLQNIHSRDKSYMIIPPNWEAGIFEKAGDNKSLMDSIAHHNGEIAKNILAQFINLGSSGQTGGSRALGEAFEEMFMLSLNAGANYVCDVMNRRLIRKIVDMNWNVEKYPTLNHSRIILDIGKFMTSISALGGNTMLTKDEDTENHLRDILGFPAINLNRGTIPTPSGIINDKTSDTEIIPDQYKQVPITVPTDQEAVGNPAQTNTQKDIPQYSPLGNAQTAVEPAQKKMSQKGARRRLLTDLESRLISIDFIEKTLDDHEKHWTTNVIKVRNQQIKDVAHDVLHKPAHEIKARYVEKMQDRILDECLKAYSNGKKQVHNEINSQKNNVKTVKQLADTIYKQGDTWAGKEVKLTLKKQAELDAAMMANKLVNTALYEVSQLDEEMTIAEQEAFIVKKLEQSGVKEIANTANKSIAMAYGMGREVAAHELSDQIEYAVYSVILDANACADCLPKDQVKHALDDTEFQTPNPHCYGGAHRCRCMNVYVLEGMVGEFETRSKEDYINIKNNLGG